MHALGYVGARFAGRVSIVDAQRTERRIPDETRAEGGTDALGVRDRQRLRQRWKRSRAAIAPQTSGICKCCGLQGDLRRQPWDRRLQFRGGCPVAAAADVVVGGARRDVARPEAVDGKSSHQLRTSKEAAHQRQRLSTIGRDVSALNPRHADNVVAKVMVITGVSGGSQEVNGAARAGQVLAKLDAQTVM